MIRAREHILQKLAEQGLRITAARRQIVTELLTLSEPITIQELARRVDANETSVYRTIETLREKGLVEEIQVRGGRPQFAVAHHHHHHAVCQRCGLIKHVPCEQSIRSPQIPGFAELEEHEVTFYGLCNNCS